MGNTQTESNYRTSCLSAGTVVQPACLCQADSSVKELCPHFLPPLTSRGSLPNIAL
jgi:hypothetical protein